MRRTSSATIQQGGCSQPWPCVRLVGSCHASVAPTRNILGQNTLITRSIHKFAYDPVKDEIVVPQFQAQAILFSRGGANGDEAPVRVIKGPDVKLPNIDQLAIDPVHKRNIYWCLQRISKA